MESVILPRVLHILDSLNRGGAEVLELDLLRNAAANGLDLTVAATGGGALELDFAALGKQFVRLQRRLPLDPHLILSLRNLIKRERIQIVHGHQAVDGLHMYFATLGLNVKRALTFHGYVPDAKNRKALEFLIPRMDANIYVSEDLRQWLAANHRLDTSLRAHVVHNGVDARRLQPTRVDLRAALGVADSDIVLGMVGNFYAAPRKDQLTLCQALPILLQHAHNVHLLLIGSCAENAGDKLDQCKRVCAEHGISDRVSFLGARPDVPDLLHAMDIFVLSSLQEGLPIAAIEAMLTRKATVLSDIGPLLEISQSGAYAEIFRTQDAADLAAKLLPLVVDKARRLALADRAFTYAQNQFSIAAHIARLQAVYQALL